MSSMATGLVRTTVDETWIELPADGAPSFLNVVPDVKKTSPEKLISPMALDDMTRRIESEEDHITPVTKVPHLV